MSKVKTNWTKATTNPTDAMFGLISCIESGHNAWIEVQTNGEQDFPIMKKNPELDNPFNWTMSYGVPRNAIDLESKKYFNDTVKDLTYNWIACYGTQDAIDNYQNKGIISPDMFNGIGICHPVKIEDANRYRKEIVKDGYEYGYWITIWKPKDNIPYWVVDDSISKVLVICYDDEPKINKKEALKRAGEFLVQYALEYEE